MKLVAAGLVVFGLVGGAQRNPTLAASPDEVTVRAEKEIKDGPTIKLRGHVEVSTGSITVNTDEADYNPLTGELDPRGHVHVVLKDASPRLKIQDSSPEDTPVIR